MTLENFKLPLMYQNKIQKIDENVVNDLELKKTKNHESIYNHILNPQTIFGEKSLNLWSEYFSYDKNYLEQTKEVIKKLEYKKSTDICFNEINDLYQEINDNNFFNQEFSYIDFDFFDIKFLNQNEILLLVLSIYNITSPIIALLTPIILLIIPFFLIKIQGYPITLNKYIEFLKKSFKGHALGGLFEDFSSIGLEKKVYIGVSLFFFIYQIFQNVKQCIQYFANLKYIHESIFKLKNYLELTIENMKNFTNICKNLKCYKLFNNNLTNHCNFLESFKNKLHNVTDYKLNIKKIQQLGFILKLFYNLKNDENHLNSLEYSFYFNGYLENLSEIKKNISLNLMNFSHYSKKETKFNNLFYAPLKYNNPITNSVNFNKHIVITGPNASGKTTILKSCAINILLNQQVGAGFYQSASLKLYNYIHSYINIPDTSGRDSLFQAEARRCKEIIDKISENPTNKNHFCIFDELYSGTNPYEAISSAFSLLQYLNNYKNLNFILTTHYSDLCEKLEKYPSIELLKMKVINNKENNNFDYTYKIEKGISKIRGGSKVLKDLKYPTKIITSVQETILQISL